MTCRHPLRQMYEGFHVCNRSRGHCPILVMSPEPKSPMEILPQSPLIYYEPAVPPLLTDALLDRMLAPEAKRNSDTVFMVKTVCFVVFQTKAYIPDKARCYQSCCRKKYIFIIFNFNYDISRIDTPRIELTRATLPTV